MRRWKLWFCCLSIISLVSTSGCSDNKENVSNGKDGAVTSDRSVEDTGVTDSSLADVVVDAADGGNETKPPDIDFGYYRVDRVPSGGPCHVDVVKGWTNLAYLDWWADARAFDYDPGESMDQVRANMDGILQRITEQGLYVVMDVAYGAAWGPRLTRQAILETAGPYWDYVKYIMLGDELTLTLADAESAISEFRTAMTNMGMTQRPIGVTLTPAYVLSDPEMLQADWDYIAIEGYTPVCQCGSCGMGSPQEEVAAISQHVAQQEAIIPAQIDLVMVMQGYDRNGAFTGLDALVEINRATYFEMVKGKPRYQAIIIFNWDREGSTCDSNPYPGHGHGSSGYPELQAAHQQIWQDLTTP